MNIITLQTQIEEMTLKIDEEIENEIMAKVKMVTRINVDKMALIDMVNRNEAKKPIETKIGTYGKALGCPNCEKIIVNIGSSKPTFCHHCGQRFDLEVEE